MLIQGVIMGKQVISVCYCDGVRAACGESVVPVAKDTEKLKLLLNAILINDQKFEDAIKMKRLSHCFGIGSFDGKASLRITNRLNKIADGQRKVIKISSAMETFTRGGRIDVIGITSSQAMLETRQKFLKQLLNANTLISSRSFENKNILAVQLFVQWGIKKNIGKELQANFARLNATPLLYLEDGLIRSIGIGLSNEPGLSIIWDSKTPYYNAKIPSCLEESLEHDNISNEDKAYARLAIDKIVANKVSKYNDAPIFRLQPETCHEGRKRILLVDQRYGDASIEYGLADARTFDKMLKDAMNTEEPCDIIIKQHPDALKGGKQSAFNKERIDEVCRSQTQNTIISIAFDINPYCLFDAVDEVWVCTSGMGFEALMAGKKVRCYGMPFYAGWGLTEDMISLPRRTRKRSIEEVFHYAYVAFSRYYDPDKGECVNVDGIVDYIMRHRDQP
jgi:capsule polysaccharide export protein KpsC/LpsZ